jgi:hypothetical protein
VSDPPQNIYDDPAFFAGYATLERFGAGWERAVEHADLLPCCRMCRAGVGARTVRKWFARYAAQGDAGCEIPRAGRIVVLGPHRPCGPIG